MAKILTVSHQSHQFMEILKKKKKWQGLLLRFALTFSACKQNIRNWGKSKERIPETNKPTIRAKQKKTKQNKTKLRQTERTNVNVIALVYFYFLILISADPYELWRPSGCRDWYRNIFAPDCQSWFSSQNMDNISC